jgi:MFS transporter, MHS family, proline/betaine transporter
MAEAFPARVRVTGVAVAYNLSLGVLGGAAPVVVTSVLAWSHDPLTPAYYMMAATAVSLVVVWRWPEPVKAPLSRAR